MKLIIYRIQMKFKTWGQKLKKLFIQTTDISYFQKRAFRKSESYKKKRPYKITRVGLPFIKKDVAIVGGERFDQILNRNKRSKKINFKKNKRYRKAA